MPLPDGVDPNHSIAQIARWQVRWPEGRQASDPRRFAATVGTYLEVAGLTAGDDVVRFDTPRATELIADEELTPAQAVLVLLVERGGAEYLQALRATGRYILVTSELETASPLIEALPPEDRVQLRHSKNQ